MAKYGTLINLDRCTGCRTHEVVCRTEGNEAIRQPLIAISQPGPDGTPILEYCHFVQAKCGLSRSCAERVGQGLDPRCIGACQSKARVFGQMEKLVEYMKDKNMPHCVIIPF